MGLESEAERLVRMGASRAEVSRRLGVPLPTLAGSALRGGWRRTDPDMERNADLTRRMLCAIRDGNRMVDAEHALRAFMREAVERLAPPEEPDLSKAGEGGLVQHADARREP